MATELSRRNFLFGAVATSAATGLVLAAPEAAMKLFKPSLSETLSIMRRPSPEDAYKYVASGQMITNPAMCTIWFQDGTTYTFQVAQIDVEKEREIIDVTSFNQNFDYAVPGLQRIYDIHLRPAGPVTVSQHL